jgi:uridylate kinase
MRQQNKQTIIISLGGSLMVPDDIDAKFLKDFKKYILKFSKKFNFVILVGGGKTARNYQKVLSDFGVKNIEKDWIGIFASRLNAELVKNIFDKNSHKEIITDPTKKFTTQKNIIIGAGWKPGNSTDYVSVITAKTYNIKTIINLTNVDYVYDKNPKDFSNAKHFENISWKDFQKIVGTKWSPGLSMPFDPRASLIANKQKMKVVIINGSKLKELEKFLNNKKFIGTIIE